MDDQEDYEEDLLSDIFPLRETSGRKKSHVWDYYESHGIKKHGHVGCICRACGWKRAVGKVCEMVDHLALSCQKVSAETRQIFLQEVRDRNTHPPPKKKQKKITASFESIEIENSKVKRINHALTRLFVCCGIPFSIVSNPFFIDFVKSLCPAYELPNRVTFAGSWVNQELATVATIIYDEAQSSTNITLGIDGWAGPNGQSIYAFILILPTGKEYIHSLKDFSLYSHTADFISKEILKVIEDVGCDKFSSVVSDNASTMVAAKKLVNEKYPHILPVRCITHHVNLLTTDIMKHEFSKSTISKCMTIIKYFKRSYKSGALLSEEIKNNFIEGGGLKGYCVTRWTTSFECLQSILRCERALHNVFEKNPDTLSTEVKEIIRNRIFFQDVEELTKVIQPIKDVLTSLEYKSTTLCDCFIQLVKLAIIIKSSSMLTNMEFRSFCLEKFNLRWSQFDFKLYMLGFFFHPLYRGKGLKIGIFRQICHWAIELLINKVNGGKNSANQLVAQMSDYKDYKKPYEFGYVDTYSVASWWKMVEQKDNWIKEIALLINSIAPHNVGCERVFSVLGWMCEKRRSRLSVDRMHAMASLHAYYVTNASSEMKYAFSGLSDQQFFAELNKSFNNLSFSEDEIEEEKDELFQLEVEDNEDEDLAQDQEELSKADNKIIMDKYFDINDELQKALGVEVSVIIEREPVIITPYDHGDKNFDIDALIDANLDE
jgi:hypothetical protein